MMLMALSIVVLSIGLQMLAAIQALRLIRVTGWRAAWVMIAIALLVMAGRRAVSLADMVVNGRPIDPAPEMLALLISVLMLVGVQRISTLLRAWSTTRQRDEILRRAQNDFIATTDPFHVSAFQSLADDLAQHCGWDCVVIGLVDADGGRLPLATGGSTLPATPTAAQDLLAAGWDAVGRQTAAGAVDMVEVRVGSQEAIAVPVISGSETVGLMVFARARNKTRGCRTEGMDVVVMAIGGMIGAMRLHRQREQANRDQHCLIAELERSKRELEQFTFITSHDMQEPLRMVVLYLELLQRRYGESLTSDAQDYVGFAVDGAKHMQAMILDLLQYARLGQGEEEAAPQADAQAALEFAARQLASRSFTLTIASPLPNVAVTPAELQRVFLNLLSNAVKFRSPDRAPTITVDAEPEGDYWHFRVADNGIGIDSAYFDKIFQVFQRLHPRSEYEGTGIGLAFVKKAVESHGGKVWVESVPDQGSVFHFTLPAAPQTAASKG